MNFETFFKAFVKDVKTELTDEFDRNFERKAFFNESWPGTGIPNSRGSLMMRTGALRRSIKSSINGGSIHFSSSLPYATIHNEGGTITVTAQMKKFFWAMYYKSSNALTYSVKSKSVQNTKRNRKLSGEAAIWKAMALMKTGQKMKIKQRQFIGPHPQVNTAIETIANQHVAQLDINCTSCKKHDNV